VLVVLATLVVGGGVVGVVVVWGGGVLALLLDGDPPPVHLTVTTAREGIETVAAPPERLTLVVATWCVLSVKYAVAAEGVKELKETFADCEAELLFTKTMMTDPSVLMYAVMPTLEMDPEVETRNAPGRMKREYCAKAQIIEPGETVDPLAWTKLEVEGEALVSTPSQ